MSRHDYPHAVTIATVVEREKRGLNWAKQAIELAHQNLLVAAKDIPDTPEYDEVRRAIHRALDRMRQARGALSTAHDAAAEAMLTAQRSAPAYLRNERLIERYGSGQHGADQVREARKERDRREAEYGERERWKREMERKRFLGEGMRDNQD